MSGETGNNGQPGLLRCLISASVGNQYQVVSIFFNSNRVHPGSSAVRPSTYRTYRPKHKEKECHRVYLKEASPPMLAL